MVYFSTWQAKLPMEHKNKGSRRCARLMNKASRFFKYFHVFFGIQRTQEDFRMTGLQYDRRQKIEIKLTFTSARF